MHVCDPFIFKCLKLSCFHLPPFHSIPLKVKLWSPILLLSARLCLITWYHHVYFHSWFAVASERVMWHRPARICPLLPNYLNKDPKRWRISCERCMKCCICRQLSHTGFFFLFYFHFNLLFSANCVPPAAPTLPSIQGSRFRFHAINQFNHDPQSELMNMAPTNGKESQRCLFLVACWWNLCWLRWEGPEFWWFSN